MDDLEKKIVAKQWGDKFEMFLVDEHAEIYTGFDDDMPDAFEKWLQELSHDEIIELVGKFIVSLNWRVPK